MIPGGHWSHSVITSIRVPIGSGLPLTAVRRWEVRRHTIYSVDRLGMVLYLNQDAIDGRVGSFAEGFEVPSK